MPKLKVNYHVGKDISFRNLAVDMVILSRRWNVPSLAKVLGITPQSLEKHVQNRMRELEGKAKEFKETEESK